MIKKVTRPNTQGGYHPSPSETTPPDLTRLAHRIKGMSPFLKFPSNRPPGNHRFTLLKIKHSLTNIFHRIVRRET